MMSVGRVLAVSFAISILAGAAVPLYQWGRLLPIDLALLRQEDRNRDGRPDRWEYHRPSRPEQRIVQLDDDFDGRAERLTRVLGPELTADFFRPNGVSEGGRHLVLCLDGVPYEVIRDLWNQGFFHEFHAPSKLISTFPADSELALATVLRAPPVRGYENRYFDRKENRLRGGISVTLRQDTSYHRLLDYDFPGWLRGPAFVIPGRALRDDLVRLHRSFLRTRARVFIAHLATTDSMLHVRSPEKARPYLLMIDALIRELFLTSEGRLEITLFSDHGNTLVPSRRVPLEAFLQAQGYRLADRLGPEKAVVIPRYGLIGAVALYARREDVPELARRLVHLEGVDLAVYRDGSGVLVEGRRGRARIHFDRERDAYRYEALEGDPLRLLPLVQRLTREGKIEADGFIRQNELFIATANGPYPDALRRLVRAFDGPVENPADLLLSLDDGYFFGSSTFDRIVRLQGTHGSLTARSSTGFIMTTTTPLPDVVSIDEALDQVVARAGRRSDHQGDR